MQNIKLKGFICSILLALSNNVFAKPVDLLTVFSDAAKYNPVYQSQIAQFQATEQNIPESRSVLLPQLSLSAQIDRERYDVTHNGASTLNSSNYGVNIQQTIFNLNAFQQYARAKLTVRSAAATLMSQQQELMINTADAYYRVLELQDILDYTRQQKAFTKKQLESTRLRYKHGEATITELDQAQGVYNLILNEEAESQLNLYDSEQELSVITSKHYHELANLKRKYPLISPDPASMNAWIHVAEKQNYALNASRFTVAAAHKNIAVQEGSYLPTLSATAGYANEKSPSTRTGRDPGLQHAQTTSVGLNANWSVFEGGITISDVARATADYERSEADFRNRYLSVLSNTRQAYRGVILGKQSIVTVKQSIRFNSSALVHAEESYRMGEQTITEVFQIQTQLYQAQTEYARDLYRYLTDLLRLQQAAGTLSVKSLAVQNAWLMKT